jgi:hypothetical protein
VVEELASSLNYGPRMHLMNGFDKTRSIANLLEDESFV